jgi:hypothetical protein
MQNGHNKGAILDAPDYRYLLWRSWSLPPKMEDAKICMFMMLNPSTADACEDDPTIRRCINFAKNTFECDALVVANLFAVRATDPRVLLTHPHPVGPLNDDYIEAAVDISSVVVCAWGTKGDIKHWGGERRGSEWALKLMRIHPRTVCLGRTKHGHPKHPLYLANNTEPTMFPELQEKG